MKTGWGGIGEGAKRSNWNERTGVYGCLECPSKTPTGYKITNWIEIEYIDEESG